MLPTEPRETDWVGLYPPQQILADREFVDVVLDPPALEPGHWTGAGDVWIDRDAGEYWLTTRWRSPHEKGASWASGVQVLRSDDGVDFEEVVSMHRTDLSDRFADDRIVGVENQQLLRDPRTGRFHLYLSLHKHERGWETGLMTADDPGGPWTAEGTVLSLDDDRDVWNARDATMGIVDGQYVAIYKSTAPGEGTRPALATSQDGFDWQKRGRFTVDGGDPRPNYIRGGDLMLLSGSIFAGARGPVFVGMDNRSIVNSTTCGDLFAAYGVDLRNVDLEPIYQDRWTPQSPYEREDYPIHSYMNVVPDPLEDRLLVYVQGIDPEHSEAVGLDEEVSRLLLYEVPL
ncbi:MAG: hypothetical protein ABEJ08_01995 [Halobacteriaceae archaeon]